MLKKARTGQLREPGPGNQGQGETGRHEAARDAAGRNGAGTDRMAGKWERTKGVRGECAVAFQGERGAYSEEAVYARFGPVPVLPCRTMPDVFAAVERGQACRALVPVENSVAGSINETYDLLLHHDLLIQGEVILRVNHCLLALPGQSLADIRRVYSHPQALAQCEHYLHRLGVETVAVYDTAGSARQVREKGLKGCAAVASRQAATIYGLDVLAEGIQSHKDNFTRFYVIGREEAQKGKRNKTVLVLSTAHRPGALFWCLGAFACRQVNLLKLESRPSRHRPWEYIFYLDIEGHVSDGDVQEALAELATKTHMLRVLGSFPQAEECLDGGTPSPLSGSGTGTFFLAGSSK